MADKVFTVEDRLPLGVSLNMPPFLGNKGQMSPEEVVEAQSIASLRIHVERGINKIKKNFSERWPEKQRTNGHLLVSLEDKGNGGI